MPEERQSRWQYVSKDREGEHDIATWRLPIGHGWLYRVARLDRWSDALLSECVTFVPEPT